MIFAIFFTFLKCGNSAGQLHFLKSKQMGPSMFSSRKVRFKVYGATRHGRHAQGHIETVQCFSSSFQISKNSGQQTW